MNSFPLGHREREDRVPSEGKKKKGKKGFKSSSKEGKTKSVPTFGSKSLLRLERGGRTTPLTGKKE